MKFLIAVILLFSLELTFPVSSQSVSEELLNLIAINDNANREAANKMVANYEKTMSEMYKQLQETVIPSLNKVREDRTTYINNLAHQSFRYGYDPTDCLLSFQEIFTSTPLPNITDKAVNEFTVFIDPIGKDIDETGIHNIHVISKEVDSLTTDYHECMNSEIPQNCNRTAFLRRVLTKQEELPLLYEKEVERNKLSFVELLVSYENRIQDYIHEAITAAKPYLAFLESCVTKIIARG